MGKKHLTRDEILRKLNQIKVAKIASEKSSPMVMTTLALYILMYENFSKPDLLKFNKYMIEHINDDVEEANKYIFEKTNWTIDIQDRKELQIEDKRNDFWNNLQDKINDYDYSIFCYAQSYIAIMLKYLILFKKYGKKRLQRIADKFTSAIYDENSGYDTEKMKKELFDKYGIVTNMS